VADLASQGVAGARQLHKVEMKIADVCRGINPCVAATRDVVQFSNDLKFLQGKEVPIVKAVLWFHCQRKVDCFVGLLDWTSAWHAFRCFLKDGDGTAYSPDRPRSSVLLLGLRQDEEINFATAMYCDGFFGDKLYELVEETTDGAELRDQGEVFLENV
jgi:hypothetical protein